MLPRQSGDGPLPAFGFVAFGTVRVAEGQIGRWSVVPSLGGRQLALEVGEREPRLLALNPLPRLIVREQSRHLGLLPPLGPHREHTGGVRLQPQEVQERRSRQRDVTSSGQQNCIHEDGTCDESVPTRDRGDVGAWSQPGR